MCALISAVKKYPVKLRVLSEASETSSWLEMTHQCLIEPTIGPMSTNTHVYQLQVLYPVSRVVETTNTNYNDSVDRQGV